MRLDHIPSISDGVLDVVIRDLQTHIDGTPDGTFLQYLIDNPKHHGLLKIVKRFIDILAAMKENHRK